MKSFVFISFALLLGTLLQAQQTFVFATRDTVDLKMDIYQPTHPRADKAAVLYVFGGGFASGERNNEYSKQCCQMLADKGFVAVAIDYRLYFKHPAKTSLLKAYHLFDTAICWAVEDCVEAIAFLYHNAKELNIDPSKLVLTGCSAGAITVLQTDYSRANRLPIAAKLPQDFVPAAVIPYAGGIFCDISELQYATPPAPTCLFHGTADKIVSYTRFRGSLRMALNGSNTLAKLFAKNKYNYWIFRYQDRGHEIAIALPNTINEFCAFVDAVFAGRVMQYDATCIDSSIKRTKWTDMNLLDLYRM